MNMYAWLEEIKTQPTKKPFPILSFPGIQYMDGLTVRELVCSAQLQAECMKKVADLTDSLASVSLMDLSLEAEAFGAEAMFFDDEPPAIQGALVTTQEEADSLQIPEVGAARTGMAVEGIRQAKQLITDRPVFAGVLGPFSIVGRLVDVSEAMILCYTEPEMLETLLDKVAEFSIHYIRAFKEAGADGVVMAEPLAGVISPALEQDLSAPYVKKIVEAVQDENFLVIYHNCGNYAYLMTESFKENGCKAFHFGNSVDMEQMLQKMGGDFVVMGNIDPAGQFRNGTPETMREAVMDLMERCSVYPNFVPSSGCDLPPVCAWENIRAFYETVNHFYSERN